LVQEQSYYPFGLQMAAISDKALLKTTTAEKFNAGNGLEEGIEYYNTFYRKYDARIGRFTGIDMLAESFAGITPYQFGNNNPVSNNDPMGDKYTDPQGTTWHHADPLAGTAAAGYVEGEDSWGGFTTGGGGGDFSAFWSYVLKAAFEATPTSIVTTIPGFGQYYFGFDGTTSSWGLFAMSNNSAYTGNNSTYAALSQTLSDFATSGNLVISSRFFQMLTGNITHNIYTVGSLPATVTNAAGNITGTNTLFSLSANGVREDRIEKNGYSDYRANFAKDFLSTTYLISRSSIVQPRNQLANAYYKPSGEIAWVQGNRSSQKPQYGTVGQFVQSTGFDADRAYVENATLYRYQREQRTFYTGLFLNANGNNFPSSGTGTIPITFYGIFMYDGFHY
jgi:RHS repeat-associated protein